MAERKPKQCLLGMAVVMGIDKGICGDVRLLKKLELHVSVCPKPWHRGTGVVLVEVGASNGCDKAATVVVVASTLSKSREKNRQPTISLYRPALASLAGHQHLSNDS